MTDTYTLELNDGRTLAYACYGRADGKPLHFMHGFPGSRYQAALIYEQAKSGGVFVVAPERPGFGKTTLMPRWKDGHLSVLVSRVAEVFSDFVASASN